MSIFEKLKRQDRKAVELEGYGVTVYVRALTLAEGAEVDAAEGYYDRLCAQIYYGCEDSEGGRVFASREQVMEIDAPVALTLSGELTALTKAKLASVDEAEKK